MIDEPRLRRVKAAADKLLNELLGTSVASLEETHSNFAKLGIVQVALTAPMATIGNCAQDGSELHFEGRADGLYVCCADIPAHCWKVG